MGPAGQAQAIGNLGGWDPSNPNQAQLTGIVFPTGIRDPYVYNFYLSVQREILPKTVVEARYVGTAGHKLFRAEDINREPGALLPAGVTVTDNLGRTLTGLGHNLNPNYGKLRNWENAVNSNYNSLQASLKRQMTHGLLFNVDYTYSHSIDAGSTWHSGATTANGAAAGEGYTLDQTLPGLDRGNSTVRHPPSAGVQLRLAASGPKPQGDRGSDCRRLVAEWHLELPEWCALGTLRSNGPRLKEADNPTNCTAADYTNNACFNFGGDYNLDHGRNDRPDSSVKSFGDFSRNVWANGWCSGIPGASVIGGCEANGGTPNQANLPILTRPTCLGCVGNLGRNSFVGPGNWAADVTLSKIFKLTERVNMKFDANAFNVFNRANFILATAGGGASNKPGQQGNFGQAAGTLRAREMQFGLKFSF